MLDALIYIGVRSAREPHHNSTAAGETLSSLQRGKVIGAFDSTLFPQADLLAGAGTAVLRVPFCSRRGIYIAARNSLVQAAAASSSSSVDMDTRPDSRSNRADLTEKGVHLALCSEWKIERLTLVLVSELTTPWMVCFTCAGHEA